jgi:hypothetical protein
MEGLHFTELTGIPISGNSYRHHSKGLRAVFGYFDERPQLLVCRTCMRLPFNHCPERTVYNRSCPFGAVARKPRACPAKRKLWSLMGNSHKRPCRVLSLHTSEHTLQNATGALRLLLRQVWQLYRTLIGGCLAAEAPAPAENLGVPAVHTMAP